MKKRIFPLGLAALAALFMFVSIGCSTDSDDDSYPETLANAVYGGETMSPNWITITFQEGGKAVASFAGTDASSTNYGDYTYDAVLGTGTLPGPGAFQISPDGKTLSFKNLFDNHGPKDIKRLRASNGTIDTAPNTFSAGPAANLAGAVYGGENPGGHWVTFQFKTGGKIAVAFGSNSPPVFPAVTVGSTNDWEFTYDADKDLATDTEGVQHGKVIHPTGGGLGPFSNGGGTPYFNISGTNGVNLDFEHFMANPRSFKRYR